MRLKVIEVWRNGKWEEQEAHVDKSFLCARPGCNRFPHRAAGRRKRRFCSRECQMVVKRALGLEKKK